MKTESRNPRGENTVSLAAERWQMMLTLLGHCYASGLYASREIEEIIRRDRIFDRLWAHRSPDCREIQQFRRRHRDSLEQHLACVLQRGWLLPPGPYRTQEAATHEERYAAAARQRIETAILMDTTANE